ncbi:MAG TPA: UbiA prenyltransferase family protein [Candidatus Thermoplasmatota archaeon]|nr:UbiA prenyltransferase family protein [Candidatus Thermoplasmatota archaeon]
MLREYLKLARSFNAVLTGMSPVMGAIALRQYNILMLLLLFLVGFFGHTFGFVFNDILDYNLDKSSKEISDRPLVSGTISLRNAWIFAFVSMAIAFLLAFYIALTTSRLYSIPILVASALFIILYDLVSKKILLTDFFVAFGIFLLVMYGASTTVASLSAFTPLTWVVCLLAAIQVLFMQLIAGGMKDIENDYRHGAHTVAIHMGVRVTEGKLIVSRSYKALSYGIQLVDLAVVFLPFAFGLTSPIEPIYQYVQWIALIMVGIVMFFLSHKLLTLERFERQKARVYIGSHYMINFTLVPIMLMGLNPWAGILMFCPALGFVLSNLALHGTLLQPKTM